MELITLETQGLEQFFFFFLRCQMLIYYQRLIVQKAAEKQNPRSSLSLEITYYIFQNGEVKI